MRHMWMAWIVVSAWAQAPAPLTGIWQGALDTGAVKLRLALHVRTAPGGELQASLDSLDQNAMGLPASEITLVGNRLRVAFAGLRATYEGTLSEDGGRITGTFTQGASLPLEWRRVEQLERRVRTQTPQPPFPYRVEEVRYRSGAAQLAGALTLPPGRGPFAAALLISGSGPQDRDQTLFEHKPFLVLADYLTRQGIAVLRVDDRGVGGSTGRSSELTLEDMAADALAGVDFLKSRPEIDAQRIGLIGHSEGRRGRSPGRVAILQRGVRRHVGRARRHRRGAAAGAGRHHRARRRRQ